MLGGPSPFPYSPLPHVLYTQGCGTRGFPCPPLPHAEPPCPRFPLQGHGTVGFALHTQPCPHCSHKGSPDTAFLGASLMPIYSSTPTTAKPPVFSEPR